MTYEYIWVTYGWYTRTYECHTDDIQGHASDVSITYEWRTDDIREQTNYIPLNMSTYEWHTDDIRVDIQMTYVYMQVKYEWHANEIKNVKGYKGFGAYISQCSTLFVLKKLLWMIANDWLLGCSDYHTFYKNILKLNYSVWEPK